MFKTKTIFKSRLCSGVRPGEHHAEPAREREEPAADGGVPDLHLLTRAHSRGTPPAPSRLGQRVREPSQRRSSPQVFLPLR
jgi:hypothetical protein